MKQTIEPRTAERLLQKTLREHVGHLKSVQQHIDVKPRNAESLIWLDKSKSSDADLYFCIEPMTYRIHERAGVGTPNLFVVIEGFVKISRTTRNDCLLTTAFGTRVAYFRYKAKDSILRHDFGIHYDFDSESIDHPAFHAQFNTFQNLHTSVNDEFKLGANVDDRMSHLIRGVRIPTAQMDVFSVILQICADHAMAKDSEKQQLDAFRKLRESCKVLVGAAHALPRFDHSDPNCYRAAHWYES